MDNFQIDIRSNGHLSAALVVAFAQHRTAVTWRTDERDGIPRLVFAWIAKEGWHPFPTPIDAAAAVDVVTRWLAEAQYGREPDHDGDNGKGWRIYCETWGHVAPYGYPAFLAVEPLWACYGK